MSQDNALARVHNATSLLCFALPSVGMMLFMGLYTLADTACVSRLAGTDALAALNIVCPVINITVGLGSMLASGGCALISRSMGEGNMPLARQNLTMIILFGTALGVLLSVSGLWQLDAIVVALGASARLFPLCRAYLGVLLAFMPAGMLQTLYTNLFAAAGRPGLGMALSAAAGALNVALDILLMTTGHMGIAGAALGTGLGYLLPAAAGTVFFARGRNTLRFARPAWRPRSLTLSMANGASELVGQLACAVTTVLFQPVDDALAGRGRRCCHHGIHLRAIPAQYGVHRLFHRRGPLDRLPLRRGRRAGAAPAHRALSAPRLPDRRVDIHFLSPFRSTTRRPAHPR